MQQNYLNRNPGCTKAIPTGVRLGNGHQLIFVRGEPRHDFAIQPIGHRQPIGFRSGFDAFAQAHREKRRNRFSYVRSCGPSHSSFWSVFCRGVGSIHRERRVQRFFQAAMGVGLGTHTAPPSFVPVPSVPFAALARKAARGKSSNFNSGRSSIGRPFNARSALAICGSFSIAFN